MVDDQDKTQLEPAAEAPKARAAKAQPADPAALPKGTFKLPEAASWQDIKPKPRPDARRFGMVVGLDYEKWAPALIDLQQDEARVSSQRDRLFDRGYRRVEGSPIVIGWPRPEVWVKPRHLFDEARRARRKQLREDVRSRRVADTALQRPKVAYIDQHGTELPVDE